MGDSETWVNMVNSFFFFSFSFSSSSSSSSDQVVPRVSVTSSGRTVKRVTQQLDDDPDQEVT